MNKRESIKFMRWLRNGISFCVTWFLLLMVLAGYVLHNEAISILTLGKMMILTSGGVFMFCVCFTSLIIKRLQFVGRLSCFMLFLSVYEYIGLYWIGFFISKGSIVQWTSFIFIVLLFYFACIGCYEIYSKKKGELYTEALKSYQARK